MFDLGNFIEDCKSALARDSSHKGIADLMARAMHDPGAVLQELGEPTVGGVFPLYRSREMTVVSVIWQPGMTIMPHNHDMWAVIGIYGGREDNIFWRRIKDDSEGRIEAAGAKSLSTGQYSPLGRDIIHSVTNPIQKLSGAIHVYGGDFFDAHQSEWDAEHLTEHARDMEKVRAAFGMN